MFELKAIKGNIDLSQFDLSSLIDEANKNARDIDSHNEEVIKRFKELIYSYYEELCDICETLDLPLFKINNTRDESVPHMRNLRVSRRYSETKWKEERMFFTQQGAIQSIEFGHGRGYIRITFTAPLESCGRRLSFDFKGVLRVSKMWLDDYPSSNKEYPLESVSQIVELGQDVFKLHIIDRDINDYKERSLQESKLIY
jgi:hypothetical protein